MTRVFASVAVVVPTKNRAGDLDVTIAGVFDQTVLPKQLIVIDQSANDDSQRLVVARLEALDIEVRHSLELSYIRDVNIPGLTAARNRALQLVREEIVLFLDDDVVLERDFIEQILAGYRQWPGATGISGIITNYPAPPAVFRYWSRIFTCGPFWDDRQPVYWDASALCSAAPIRVTRLGGGLMSFRMAAIAGASFDENLRGAAPGEDVEFCAGLGPDTLLLIAPKARLAHKKSAAGRAPEHWLSLHAFTMFYIYRRHWNHGPVNKLCFLWLNIGYTLAATLVSARRLSRAPWQGLAKSRSGLPR